MKATNLKFIQKILRGLLDGTLALHVVPTGKAPAAIGGAKRGRKPSRKPGRKPLSPTIKKQQQLRQKAAKIRKEKSLLPTPRDLFLFLADKYQGVKLTALASQFKVKRNLLKPMVLKLVDKGDIVDDHGTYYLKRRVRGVGQTEEKPTPITERQVLDYLNKKPDSTLSGMAHDMKEKSYQRLIRVINRLKKAGKVVKDGKTYSLAD